MHRLPPHFGPFSLECELQTAAPPGFRRFLGTRSGAAGGVIIHVIVVPRAADVAPALRRLVGAQRHAHPDVIPILAWGNRRNLVWYATPPYAALPAADGEGGVSRHARSPRGAGAGQDGAREYELGRTEEGRVVFTTVLPAPRHEWDLGRDLRGIARRAAASPGLSVPVGGDGHPLPEALAIAAHGPEDDREVPPHPPLVGRDRQLAELLAILRDLGDRVSPVTLVTGPAGSGKTRLVAELAARAAALGARIVWGAGVTGPRSPRAPQPLSPPALSALRAPMAQVIATLAAHATPLAIGSLRRHARLLAHYFDVPKPLRNAGEGIELLRLSARDSTRMLFEAMVDVLLALASQAPVVLVLDDLAQLDGLTLGFLEHVAKNRPFGRGALLVVGVVTIPAPAEAVQELLATRRAIRIALPPLDQDAALELVRACRGGRALDDPEAVRSIVKHGAGLPLAIALACRAWRPGTRFLPPESEGTRSSAGAAPAASSAVDAPVDGAARALLSSLPDAARRYLDAAFATGSGGPWPGAVAGRVARLSHEQRFGVEADLCADGLILECQGDFLRFAHRAIADVVACAPGPRALQRPRRRAQAILDSSWGARIGEDPAANACRLDALEDDAAFGSYVAAAREAWLQLDVASAEQRYACALAAGRKGRHPLATTHLELAESVYGGLERWADAERECRLALPLLPADDLQAQARAHLLLGKTLTALLRFDEARQEVERSLAICGEQGNDVTQLGAALEQLARINQSQGELAEAATLLDRALTVFSRGRSRRDEARVIVKLGDVYARLGFVGLAEALYKEALAIRAELGDTRLEGLALVNYGALQRLRGEAQDAIQLFEQAIDRFVGTGDRRQQGFALTHLGAALMDAGEPDAARERFAEALSLNRETGNRGPEAYTLYHLGILFTDEGLFDEGRSFLEEAIALHCELGSLRGEGTSLAGLSRLDRRNHRFIEAESNINRAVQLVRRAGDAARLATVLCERGHVSLALGRSARADLSEAEGIVQVLDVAEHSRLARAIHELRSAQGAFESGVPLSQGELWL
ncbi:MAG: tetratricopeptide repeat protein [Candidatus Schekmanbacteria bacterium]|nr:tetratricopeptide repeat protein [Candidatus Schekmanbacteria bacterium]